MRVSELLNKNSIAGRLENGELVSLADEVPPGTIIRGIPKQTSEGREVYRRGLILALDAAAKRVYPDSELWVEHSISLGYRCRLENRPKCLSEEIVEKLTEELKNIVNESLPIEYLRIADVSRLPEGCQRLARWKYSDGIFAANLLGSSCAFAMGPAVPNTSWLDKWELKPSDGSFVLRFPGSANWPEIPEWKPRKKLEHEFDIEEKHGRRMQVQNINQLNEHIEEDGGRKILIMSHFYQTYKMVEMVKELEDAFPRRRIITIAGPSSSGKTTFALLLRTYLRAQGFKAKVINLDNYFKNRSDTPIDKDGNPDFECIEAIETKLLGQHLKAILEGEEVLLPVFDFKQGVRRDGEQMIRLDSREMLIIEGIHGLNDALTPGISPESKYKIYVSALTQLNIDRLTRMSTSDSRLIRRMVRDSTQRGYDAEMTISIWPIVKRGERNNIYPYQEQADAMFNSSLPVELPILKKFAEPLLRTVKAESPAYSTAQRLLRLLACIKPIDLDLLPKTSLLREFTGGLIFKKGRT